MNQQTWDLKSDAEKIQYLREHNPNMSSQAVMNGKARPGDPDAFRTLYTVSRGGVITAQAYDMQEAVNQDLSVIDGDML